MALLNNLNEHQQKVLATAKRNVRSKAQAKALAALEHRNDPHAEKPPVKADYMAITEEAHRGERIVERGDGTALAFKDAQYMTNDPVEAKMLAATPGVKVQAMHAQRRGRVSFVVPALPWHKDKDHADEADTLPQD